jgi:hypothetical protein
MASNCLHSQPPQVPTCSTHVVRPTGDAIAREIVDMIRTIATILTRMRRALVDFCIKVAKIILVHLNCMIISRCECYRIVDFIIPFYTAHILIILIQ